MRLRELEHREKIKARAETEQRISKLLLIRTTGLQRRAMSRNGPRTSRDEELKSLPRLLAREQKAQPHSSLSNEKRRSKEGEQAARIQQVSWLLYMHNEGC